MVDPHPPSTFCELCMQTLTAADDMAAKGTRVINEITKRPQTLCNQCIVEELDDALHAEWIKRRNEKAGNN